MLQKLLENETELTFSSKTEVNVVPKCLLEENAEGEVDITALGEDMISLEGKLLLKMVVGICGNIKIATTLRLFLILYRNSLW